MRSEDEELTTALRVLLNCRPHSLKRLYGKRGPTPEQAAAHAEQVREWNRQYRAAQKRYKAAAQ